MNLFLIFALLLILARADDFYLRLNREKDPAPGDKLLTQKGWLQIKSELGRGAYGTVFEAEWEKPGKALDRNPHVALKINRKATKKEFRDEYKLMKLMDGVKGFPRVYGYLLEGDKMYYFMDLVGESLFKILEQQGSFPEEWVLDFALQLLDRLAALHERGYVMVDLNPGNICRDVNGKVSLIDLGKAGDFKREGLSRKSDLLDFMDHVHMLSCTGRADRKRLSKWMEPAKNYVASLGSDEKPDYARLAHLLTSNAPHAYLPH